MIRRWKDEDFEYFQGYFSTKLVEDDYGQFVLFYDHEKEIEKKDVLLNEMAESLENMIEAVRGGYKPSELCGEFEEAKSIMKKYHEQVGDTNAE